MKLISDIESESADFIMFPVSTIILLNLSDKEGVLVNCSTHSCVICYHIRGYNLLLHFVCKPQKREEEKIKEG